MEKYNNNEKEGEEMKKRSHSIIPVSVSSNRSTHRYGLLPEKHISDNMF